MGSKIQIIYSIKIIAILPCFLIMLLSEMHGAEQSRTDHHEHSVASRLGLCVFTHKLAQENSHYTQRHIDYAIPGFLQHQRARVAGYDHALEDLAIVGCGALACAQIPCCTACCCHYVVPRVGALLVSTYIMREIAAMPTQMDMQIGHWSIASGVLQDHIRAIAQQGIAKHDKHE